MNVEQVIKVLAAGSSEVENILRTSVLDWGIGGMFLLADEMFFPEWLRGEAILKLNTLTSSLDEAEHKEVGFWLREFLRFLMIHNPKAVEHTFHSDFQAFCKSYSHCYSCLQKQFTEILGNGV